MREDRALNECRKIKVTKNYIMHPAGSVLMQMGNTKVICSATVEEKVPSFLRGKESGWVTAEYSMLPSSTNRRTQREASRGKLTGRTQEIQRLIGRSLRTVIDLKKLGERTIWLDCDVIQADGGTRTASITGGYVALHLACQNLLELGVIKEIPLIGQMAAISCGIYESTAVLDLDYPEDSNAETDANFVLTGTADIVEIQGTAEDKPFSEAHLLEMLALAKKGVGELVEIQKSVLGL